ncbi:MAG: alpha/beta hydrolase [Mariniblastus sp.]
MNKTSFLTRLADRLILQATTEYIDPGDREEKFIDTFDGQIQVWISRTESKHPNPSPLLILKFPGTGGRAERSWPHPAELWPEVSAEVWTLNHRGYGESSGPASLQNFSESCNAFWSAANQQFPNHKVLVCGNSLGCISALYLAARHSINAVYLRNPPALAQMIATRPRYAWPSLGLSRLVAAQIPKELDAVENAELTECPVLTAQSELDRVIPPKFQNLAIDQLRGPCRKLIIKGADHHERASDSQKDEYHEAISWLGQFLH